MNGASPPPTTPARVAPRATRADRRAAALRAFLPPSLHLAAAGERPHGSPLRSRMAAAGTPPAGPPLPPSQPATSASCATAGNRGRIRPSPHRICSSRGRICHRDRVVVRHRRRRLPRGVAPLVALVGARHRRHRRPWVLRRRPPGPDPVTPSPDPGSAGRFRPGRRPCPLSGRLSSGGSAAVVAASRRGGLRGSRSCALVAA